MTAKTFKETPTPSKKPTAAQISSFERTGAGKDTVKTVKQESEQKRILTKRLSLDLPEELHTRFKSACVRSRYSMTDEIINLIKKRTLEIEKEIKLSELETEIKI